MNFAEKIKIITDSPSKEFSLLEWVARCEEIISEMEHNEVINVYIGEQVAAKVSRYAKSNLIIDIFSEEEVLPEFFYKDWLYFWTSLSLIGYAFWVKDRFGPFGIINSDEFYSRRHYVSNSDFGIFEINFQCSKLFSEIL